MSFQSIWLGLVVQKLLYILEHAIFSHLQLSRSLMVTICFLCALLLVSNIYH